MKRVKQVVKRALGIPTVTGTGREPRPGMEPIYRDLFLRDIGKMGIEDTYYPLSGAASHGLMYIITRCFKEFDVRRVLELGVGQTTYLMRDLREKVRPNVVIDSVDHDADWARFVGDQVGHPVQSFPLVPKTIGERSIQHYRSPFFETSAKYDLVIIDGPIATSEELAFNRLGAVEILDSLAEDFVIIIDDAERLGEAVLCDEIRKGLEARGRTFRIGTAIANKWQVIFAGGAYTSAAWF